MRWATRNPFLQASIASILVLYIMLTHASAFVYYPASLYIQPAPPTLTFGNPPYNYTCTGLVRTSRGAVTYTDFETYPLSGWTNRGGANFQLVPGHKGNALRYSDNNRGIGSASQYYYHTRLDTTYTSLWVSVKVYGSPTNTYNGLALIDNNLNRLYEISLYNGYIEVRSWNVEARKGWQQLGNASIVNYNANYWYTIVLNYAVTATVNFYVWVYDPNGNQVAYLTANSTSGNGFTPAYIGLEVDYTGTTGTGYGIFDDFIISTVDPRTVVFSNLQSGLVFNIYDDLSDLTYSFTATSSTYSLNVTPDVVLGTGAGGSIQVFYPDGSLLCLDVSIPSTDAFLGGDSYSLTTKTLMWSISSTNTSASISAYISSNPNNLTSFYAIALTASQGYYVQLQLNASASTISQSLNAQIYIQGGSQPITVVNGVANPIATDWVYLSPGSTVYIVVSKAYTSPGSASTLAFNIVACTNGRLDVDPAPGACVIYPLNMTLAAG